MLKLIVTFAQNRDVEGKIHLEENGTLLAGPFPVCGRADDTAAERHGNPSRHPLLPFGDTPLGLYQVVGLLPSGAGTALPQKIFGSHNVVILKPTGGDAALADANGRFNTLIQGGKEGRGGRLLPTNGSLRLRDKDQKKLLRALAARENLDCVCEVRAGVVAGKPVEISLPYELGDPLSGPALHELRQFIMASMFVIGSSWNMIGQFNPPIFKYLASSSRFSNILSAEKWNNSKSMGSPSGGGGPWLMAGDGYGTNENSSSGSSGLNNAPTYHEDTGSGLSNAPTNNENSGSGLSNAPTNNDTDNSGTGAASGSSGSGSSSNSTEEKGTGTGESTNSNENNGTNNATENTGTGNAAENSTENSGTGNAAENTGTSNETEKNGTENTGTGNATENTGTENSGNGTGTENTGAGTATENTTTGTSTEDNGTDKTTTGGGNTATDNNTQTTGIENAGTGNAGTEKTDNGNAAENTGTENSGTGNAAENTSSENTGAGNSAETTGAANASENAGTGSSTGAAGQLNSLAAQGENADWDGRNASGDQGNGAASPDHSQPGDVDNSVKVPLTPFENNQPVQFENQKQLDSSTVSVPQPASPESNPSAGSAPSDNNESAPAAAASNAPSQGWSAAQAVLPSIALLGMGAMAMHANSAPVPELSHEQIDAANKEAQRQKFLDDRNYLVKGMESQLSSGVATINDTIPPDARKLLWSFVAFNGVIEKSFELGGKISDAAWEDSFSFKKAASALWSREGYGLVVEVAKEIGGTKLSKTVSEIQIDSAVGPLKFEKVEEENTILGRWFKKGEDKMIASREQDLMSIIHPDWTTDKMAATHNPLDWFGDRVNQKDLQDISENIETALDIDEWSEKTELGKKLSEGSFSKPSEDSESK